MLSASTSTKNCRGTFNLFIPPLPKGEVNEVNKDHLEAALKGPHLPGLRPEDAEGLVGLNPDIMFLVGKRVGLLQRDTNIPLEASCRHLLEGPFHHLIYPHPHPSMGVKGFSFIEKQSASLS